jgi:hypothetical protein
VSYLNTDLDLTSNDDLKPLVAALENRGLITLHCARLDDGRWLATLESLTQRAEAAETIGDLLAAIEGLPPGPMAGWRACTVREFNMGYEFGPPPRPVTQALPVALLSRIVGIGASVRVTVYPDTAASEAK